MKGKRIGAFFIDYIITAMIMNIPFWILVMYPTITGNQPSDIIFRSVVSSYIAFLYLILRDLPAKGSAGKRIFKLKIVNAETGEDASVCQRLVRNLPLLLSWIEVIAFLVSRKRIGDWIAKTDVVEE